MKKKKKKTIGNSHLFSKDFDELKRKTNDLIEFYFYINKIVKTYFFLYLIYFFQKQSLFFQRKLFVLNCSKIFMINTKGKSLKVRFQVKTKQIFFQILTQKKKKNKKLIFQRFLFIYRMVIK